MNKKNMRRTRSLMLAVAVIVFGLGVAPDVFAQKSSKSKKQTVSAAPTKEIVEKVLKGMWDKSGATYPNVKVVLTLNEVKFGKAYAATLREVQVEGFPKGARVTPAVVDFTVREYGVPSIYNKTTKAVRRTREARVYKNKFDEWAVTTGSVRGEDTTTQEPVNK